MSDFLKVVLIICGSLFILATCKTTPYQQGKNLYDFYCASCHMKDGSGLGAEIPPLAGADYYARNLDRVSCIIRYGITDTITVNGKKYKNGMEGIPLDEIQITNVINYINTAWGNEYPIKKLDSVKKELQACSQ